MLNENDVVELVTKYLLDNGYTIVQSLDTNSKGIDIIADHLKTNDRLFVEAKGETSSKEHTNRFGKAFDSKQVRNHISRAVFSAMKVVSLKPAGKKTKAAIALPSTDGHKKEFENIKAAVRQLNIKVFWVDTEKVIED
jgi:Holliday junction resolvase-like predicted endonuclease